MNALDSLDILRRVKELAERGETVEAWRMLVDFAAPEDDFVRQAQYSRLMKRMADETARLRPIRIAILSNATVDHLAGVLKFWLAREGFAASLYIAPFGTVAQSILDENDELYRFSPDVVWICSSWRDCHIAVGPDYSPADIDAAVAHAAGATAALWAAVHRRLTCHIIQNNADIPAIDPLGNFAGKARWSQRNTLRRHNLLLAEMTPPAVSILDLDHLAATFGKSRWTDPRLWHHSKHAFTPDAAGPIAFVVARMVGALKGASRKALVLDLDNTLWGGVIGDDGLAGIRIGNGADGEAFAAFQRYLLSLKRQGIVLAVCSKNNATSAREPFERHPDMVIRLDDIAVFRANWDNKADNIRAIAQTLNLGLDSLVFVDDNPAERALVRRFLPMVAVPELPEDPSGYIEVLARHRYFDIETFSTEDAARADYYRDNVCRDEIRQQAVDLGDYQRTLEMVAAVNPIGSLQLARATQLINKSNQFHLTGTRYDEAEMQAFSADPDWTCLSFSLRDRFGDNGLISVLLLHQQDAATLRIDTWVMSCRVLARGTEEFVAGEILAAARARGCSRILGRYVPSKKNGLVQNLYSRLGFILLEERDGETFWLWNVATAQPPAHFIRKSAPAN